MSCGLSAEGVVALILSQQVCRAVSSIPVRSALAGPWGLNFPSTRLHTVIFAGNLFSVGSCFSQGPLNTFDYSTARIVSFVEVTSRVRCQDRWFVHRLGSAFFSYLPVGSRLPRQRYIF